MPAHVDPGTGYRYYAHDQLPRARLIARLRRLGLPLARIGYLADLTPEARIGSSAGGCDPSATCLTIGPPNSRRSIGSPMTTHSRTP